jgi:hypothetical protein
MKNLWRQRVGEEAAGKSALADKKACWRHAIIFIASYELPRPLH